MRKNLIATLATSLVVGTLVGCSEEPQVSFTSDIRPILDKHCVACHVGEGDGVKASGFQVDTYANVMKGTKYGQMVVPGDALSSSLYRLVAGKVDKSIQMPHGDEKLSASEIQAIHDWIEQGAKDN